MLSVRAGPLASIIQGPPNHRPLRTGRSPRLRGEISCVPATAFPDLRQRGSSAARRVRIVLSRSLRTRCHANCVETFAVGIVAPSHAAFVAVRWRKGLFSTAFCLPVRVKDQQQILVHTDIVSGSILSFSHRTS